ncbi:unnamed protein product [Owenia fusiformis]|uniref:Pyrrolo-quinoline quinone repeat domain-containing protein n=1 Tax=Owenia fusiformis TaxID=6347 RepID=A0A8J1TZZ0_OWEFU|nr:unnamed protein product [Owenia fusiformis]
MLTWTPHLLALIFYIPYVITQSVYWEHYGGPVGGSRYSEMTDINASNVANLEVAWTFRYGPSPWGYDYDFLAYTHQSTPIMVDDGSGNNRDLLYLCTPWRAIVAVNPATGAEVWRNNDGAQTERGGTCRGIATWLDPQKTEGSLCKRVLYIPTLDLRMMAADAATGQLCPDFGDGGFISLILDNWDCEGRGQCISYHNPPAVVGDTLVIGQGINDNFVMNTPKGLLPAFNARTGANVWNFTIIPTDPNDPAMATWLNGTTDGVGSGNAWAPLSGDSELGIVYAPTSSASGEHQGIHRPGDNHYCNSVVALNATTGALVWFKQLVHHDIWDYDLNAQPTVGIITRGGERRKVVLQGTKMGFLFVLDALTGEPVFPIEERPVPASTVPGEIVSPTQPFPVDDYLRMSAESINMRAGQDLWGRTIEGEIYCENEFMDGINPDGRIYNPATTTAGEIWVPGNHGGMNLGGTVALDPVRSITVVSLNNHPGVVQLVPNGMLPELAPEWCKSLNQPIDMPYWECTAWNMMDDTADTEPCHRPPWAKLTAVDLENGRQLWSVTNGYTPDVGADEATEGSRWTGGGILLTAGGIVIVCNTEDRHLRALDINTGATLYESAQPMPAHAAGGPITYKTGGKQYIVTTAGGHNMFGMPVENRIRSDYLYAYALPDAPTE